MDDRRAIDSRRAALQVAVAELAKRSALLSGLPHARDLREAHDRSAAGMNALVGQLLATLARSEPRQR